MHAELQISPVAPEISISGGILHTRMLDREAFQILFCVLPAEASRDDAPALQLIDQAFAALGSDLTMLAESGTRLFDALRNARSPGSFPGPLVLLQADWDDDAVAWIDFGQMAAWASGADDEPCRLPAGIAGQPLVRQARQAVGGLLLLSHPDEHAVTDEIARAFLQRALALDAPARLIQKGWQTLHCSRSGGVDAIVVQRPKPQHADMYLTIELQRSRDQLRPLREGIASFYGGLPEESVQMLELASFEAATNIVRHAPGSGEDDTICAILRRHDDEATVELIYAGEPFCPEADVMPDFSGDSDGGFGLFIIEQATDKVSYESYLPGPAPVQAHESMTAARALPSPHFTYALSGIVETDAQWRFVRCNQAAISELQRPVSLMASRPMDAWFDLEQAPEAREHFALLSLQGLCHSRLPLPGTDGKTLWLEMSSVQADDDLYIHFINNVTHEHEQAQALQEALQRAEQAAQAKSAFIASVSHELRTPLNGVIGLTRLSLQAELPFAVRQNLEKIALSGQALLHLINDILDFSKVEAGRMAYEQQPYDLWLLLDELSTTVAHSQQGKALELAFLLEPGVPRQVVGDRYRVMQVLLNLLGNAVKFTDHGHVSLTLSIAWQPGGPQTLRATVQDSGIGMTPEALGRLFEPFTQADNSITRRFGGTGLGLVIARSMAQGMGGDLRASSVAGEGSTFVLELPLTSEADAPQPPLAPRRIGIQAGRPLTRRALESVVHAIGALPVSADDPRADACLVDLPDQDAARQWVSSNLARSTLLTADADLANGLLQRLQPQHAAPVLIRPLTPLSLLAGLTGEPSRLSSTMVFEVPTEFAGACIVVAEDVPINQDVIYGLLTQAGIEVRLVGDGAQLLQLLDASALPVDLVLMDVHMPVMDGLSAARALRARGFSTPIVALSAGLQADERQQCEQAGMNDFLCKPVDPDELWGALTRWLPPRRSAAVTPPSAPPAQAQQDGLDEGWLQRCAACGIDVQDALPRFLGQAPALRRAIRSFWRQHGQDQARLRACWGAGDWGRLRQLAHALKGGGGTIGALRLQAAAGLLEQLAAQGPCEACGEALEALVRALAELELAADDESASS